jgi:hypothetical protein
MGINVAWDDAARTTIFFELDGHWTLDDCRAAREQTFMMMKSVRRHVNFIVYLQSSAQPPSGALQELLRALATAPHNWGQIVLVGRNTLPQSGACLLRRLFRHVSHAVHTAGTVAEARALLQARSRHARPTGRHCLSAIGNGQVFPCFAGE